MRFLSVSAVSRTVTATAALATLGLLALAAPANAQLLGTSVTGSLQFGGVGLNFFSPSSGFVPAGYGNSSPGTSTVTIAEPLTEFGFNDGANLDTANFTDNQLTITNVSSGANNAPFTMTFTNSAFVGLTLSTVSNTFGGTVSLAGNTLTFNAPAFGTGGTRVGVFNFTAANTAAPEPGSLALLLPVAGMVGMVIRKRRKN